MDCSQIQQQIVSDQQGIQLLEDPNYCAGEDDVARCIKEKGETITRVRNEIAQLQRDLDYCRILIGTWVISAGAYSATLTINTWDTTGPFGAMLVFADGSRGIPLVCNFATDPEHSEFFTLQVQTSFSIPGNPQSILTYQAEGLSLDTNQHYILDGTLNGVPGLVFWIAVLSSVFPTTHDPSSLTRTTSN